MPAFELLYGKIMTVQDTRSNNLQELETEPPNRGASSTAIKESFEMLESWAELHEHPEFWPDVCRKWADRIDDDDAMKRLKPILNNLFGYTAEKDGDSTEIFREKMRRAIEYAGRNTFVVDKWGVVGSIGEDAADILGFAAGECIKESLLEPLPHLFQETGQTYKGSLSEIFGRDGVRRLVNIKYIEPYSGEEEKLRISLCTVFLPAAAENYLRQKLALTDTEVEILSLSIQRHNVEGIARKRNNSVSTIRTHAQNISNKFGCKNYNDVMVRTLEIIAYHQKGRPSVLDELGDFSPTLRGAKVLKLKHNEGQVEYSIYGDPQMRPLLTMHSLEYGYQPTDEFISLAKQSGFCVYSVRRPGFGVSSPGASVASEAAILEEFLSLLDLDNILAVSFSTASPLAMTLMHSSERITQTIFVNYAFNAPSKIGQVRPKWLKGLLDLCLASQASFNFAFMLTGNLIRVRGHNGFYEKLYESCAEDLAYLRQHAGEFEKAAERLETADRDTVRREIVGNFLLNSEVDDMLSTCRGFIGLHGEHTHGVPMIPAKREAAHRKVPFFVIENAGRNCVFQRPEAFFEIVNSLQPAGAAKYG